MENKNTLQNSEDTKFRFAFGAINYILMVSGLIILFLGYILLSGGGSEDPNQFNYEMFNNRRLVVAPILIVAGFVVEIVAIMYKKKQ
jgi:heme/copper-type cytochrome/quinol oxidase subunit 2